MIVNSKKIFKVDSYEELLELNEKELVNVIGLKIEPIEVDPALSELEKINLFLSSDKNGAYMVEEVFEGFYSHYIIKCLGFCVKINTNIDIEKGSTLFVGITPYGGEGGSYVELMLPNANLDDVINLTDNEITLNIIKE